MMLVVERRMEIHIPLKAGAALRGRIFVEERLITLGYHDLLYTGALIASELVNNVGKHVPGAESCRLGLMNNRGRPLIEVTDSSFDPPVLRTSPIGEHGTGIKLIDELAAAWGYRANPHGKTVWATLL